MQRGKDTIWNPRLSLAAWGTLGNSLSLEPWSPLLYSKGGSLYPTGTVGYSIFELSSFCEIRGSLKTSVSFGSCGEAGAKR